jgi:hypothetical protein
VSLVWPCVAFLAGVIAATALGMYECFRKGGLLDQAYHEGVGDGIESERWVRARYDERHPHIVEGDEWRHA